MIWLTLAVPASASSYFSIVNLFQQEHRQYSTFSLVISNFYQHRFGSWNPCLFAKVENLMHVEFDLGLDLFSILYFKLFITLEFYCHEVSSKHSRFVLSFGQCCVRYLAKSNALIIISEMLFIIYSYKYLLGNRVK